MVYNVGMVPGREGMEKAVALIAKAAGRRMVRVSALARAAGVSTQYMYAVLRGEARLTGPETIAAVAGALNIDAAGLGVACLLDWAERNGKLPKAPAESILEAVAWWLEGREGTEAPMAAAAPAAALPETREPKYSPADRQTPARPPRPADPAPEVEEDRWWRMRRAACAGWSPDRLEGIMPMSAHERERYHKLLQVAALAGADNPWDGVSMDGDPLGGLTP